MIRTKINFMDTQPTETITITKKEYKDLLDRDERLSALEAAGVDNWEGYDVAIDIFYEQYPQYGEEEEK